MKKYSSYCAALDELLNELDWGREKHARSHPMLHANLNGGASVALRKCVSEGQQHRSGAFFTGESLGRRTIGPLVDNRKLLALPVCDPTCGGGDLLLRWAEHLPIRRDLGDTLDDWSELLHGTDIHHEFVAVAKRRLTLLAISRGAKLKKRSRPDLNFSFSNLGVSDILKAAPNLPNGTLVMNPPFTFSKAPKACQWSSGLVSNAAVATMNCIEALNPGNRIAAILPDVLRSGRRYERWRAVVGKMLSNTNVELVGRFDEHADVDVFVLSGVKAKCSKGIDWKLGQSAPGTTISSICSVKVGAVVPHRDDHRGPWRPYLTVHDLPAWGEIYANGKKRRHWATALQPPFVAVRRTSSPADAQRAIGTIVRGRQSAVLENHLIALKPTDRSIESCKRVVKILKDPRTRQWLDSRIRCRHLTVGAIREIPVCDVL